LVSHNTTSAPLGYQRKFGYGIPIGTCSTSASGATIEYKLVVVGQEWWLRFCSYSRAAACYHAVTMRSLCGHHAVIMQLPCGYHAVTSCHPLRLSRRTWGDKTTMCQAHHVASSRYQPELRKRRAVTDIQEPPARSGFFSA
jgi:hypothetical protein